MINIQEVCQFCELALIPYFGEADRAYIQNKILKNANYLLHDVPNFMKNIQDQLDHIIALKKVDTPLQYIFQEAHFMDLKLYVNQDVLIPRPETEELVDLIRKDNKDRNNLCVIDIGTGSGCIAISLKKSHPSWRINAIDISEAALAVARENADKYGVDIFFEKNDFLEDESIDVSFDIVVCNPPYIARNEIELMATETVLHEPHIALFVNHDPLEFYQRLAVFGMQQLNPKGQIYCEINEFKAQETIEVFEKSGYTDIALFDDMQSKARMLRISR